MGSFQAATAKANQIERKILKEIKSRLAEASGLASSKTLSLEEKIEIQSFLSNNGGFSKTNAENLIGAIRTQSGQSDMFLMALYRSRQLLPHIESVFKQNGLPVALARIPFVESSFNTRAESKIGAMGIWQFTTETAREMIHTEDTKQWADPLRQTKSVVRLLKMYRSVLPDWGTTVTAYNSGVGRLRRLVDKYSIRHGEELAQIPNSENTGLGFAGRNFYAEFLAANLVEAYKEDIFRHLLVPSSSSVVLKGKESMPKEICDL
jgi:membrane-bound lytic murein transglycosylase D